MSGAALAPALDRSRAAEQAGAAPASGIGFEHVTVAYKGSVALDALSLSVEPGEIMAVIGPSGCGKTTALRALAGFVRPVTGRVLIGEVDVTDLPPHARDIGMVVQNYALFPHMRVADNVAFGLHARRAPEAVVRQQVETCLAMVGMADYAERYPRQLSGGQQQRVAIARALAMQPKVMLFDEATSSLDPELTGEVLEVMRDLAREGMTMLVVTHEMGFARDASDRIIFLHDGKVEEDGTAAQVFSAPASERCQRFISSALS